MLVPLFRTWIFGHLFSMLCFSWNVIRARLMERQIGTTIEQFIRIPWDQFSFKNWFFFNSCIDLIPYRKSRNYGNVILLIWKCFYVLDDLFVVVVVVSFFFCYHKRRSIIQNLFQKLSISKTERSSPEICNIKLSV